MSSSRSTTESINHRIDHVQETEVKMKEEKDSYLQVLKFAHAQPHAPMVERLARALPRREIVEKDEHGKKTKTIEPWHTVVIDGEFK